MSIDDILNRLEAAENDFLQRDVLAPVLPGRDVIVRIAGIICTLAVTGKRFTGWGVLRPQSLKAAALVRPATLAEVTAYLKLFPALRLIVVAREGRQWHALPASEGGKGIQLSGAAPMLLAETGVQPFETVVARFDGHFFWYERRDNRRNPALAAYLRAALDAGTPTADLRKSGLSPEERAAYDWARNLVAEAERAGITGRLAAALAHAGGRLIAFTERDDSYTVAYMVGDERAVSTVRKGDLSVLTAGICLSGQDARFDLTSMVSVMREAAGQPIPRYGDEIEEDEE
ncbi:MAG TPA: hypothetical protein VFQ32_14385 [Ktedonobacterales bacterium]|nr:hypothetical protein [Ktedonobacterales bacterium]